MKALSPEALHRRALALGGRLELDGKVHNASRQTTRLGPPPTPAPTPPPTPAPEVKPAEPKQDESLKLLAETVQSIQTFASASLIVSEKNAQVIGGLQKMIEQVSTKAAEKPARRVRILEGKILRDHNDTMTGVRFVITEE